MCFSEQLLSQNRAWVRDALSDDPALFERCAKGQQPKLLWIGCSDSRVPAEVVTGAKPGEIFVHRNIANLFAPHDENTMSVVEYAIRVLGVSDIVVCGHYGCGGVRASLGPRLEDMPHVEYRIDELRMLAQRHRAELDAIPCIDARTNRLAELNVIDQAARLDALPLLRDAPLRPRVHAWIFDIRNGLIQELAHAGDAAGCHASTVARFNGAEAVRAGDAAQFSSERRQA
jgi:carbonic anhydrase